MYIVYTHYIRIVSGNTAGRKLITIVKWSRAIKIVSEEFSKAYLRNDNVVCVDISGATSRPTVQRRGIGGLFFVDRARVLEKII